ncbi:MAG: hypothetical protein ACTS6G_03010 [Candidatus Hodgkinia cicadicola]
MIGKERSKRESASEGGIERIKRKKRKRRNEKKERKKERKGNEGEEINERTHLKRKQWGLYYLSVLSIYCFLLRVSYLLRLLKSLRSFVCSLSHRCLLLLLLFLSFSFVASLFLVWLFCCCCCALRH